MAREKNTLIYSRKAYNKDERFGKIVEETSKIANNLEQHIELIQSYYPKYTIEPLYTFEHTNIMIERFERCPFDSSKDAFCAYKKEEDLIKKLESINNDLNNYDDFNDFE